MNSEHIYNNILPLLFDELDHINLNFKNISIKQFGKDKSKVNYVYRIILKGKNNLIMKLSDNIARSTGRPLVKEHLKHEFLFLRFLNSKWNHLLTDLGISVPTPVTFIEKYNAILMDDLGSNALNANELTKKDVIILAKFLSLIHALKVPNELYCSIRKSNPIKTLSDFKFSHFKNNSSFKNLKYPYPANILIVGDFSINNLIRTSDGIGIVDFDLISLGDPAYDIAHFLAFFYLIPVLTFDNCLEFSHDLMSSFINTYFENTAINQNFDINNINLYLAPLLLHRIWRFQEVTEYKKNLLWNRAIELSERIFTTPVKKVADLYDNYFFEIVEYLKGERS